MTLRSSMLVAMAVVSSLMRRGRLRPASQLHRRAGSIGPSGKRHFLLVSPRNGRRRSQLERRRGIGAGDGRQVALPSARHGSAPSASANAVGTCCQSASSASIASGLRSSLRGMILQSFVARLIGRVVAFEGDVLERQADAGDLVGRAERGGKRGRARRSSNSHRGGDAVLDFDRVDAGGDAAEDTTRWPHQVGEHVVRMDGMAHQHAAQFGLPSCRARARRNRRRRGATSVSTVPSIGLARDARRR